MWFGGKNKVFTLSYDDGVVQDEKLVEIINPYGIKCTFNLNSDFIGSKNHWKYKNLEVTYLDPKKAKSIYAGHEIAVHTCSHPHLEQLARPDILQEIQADRQKLQELFSRHVSGMAYPFGTYNDTVLSVLRECGILYSRTVVSTHSFAPPPDPLEWHFTCHHKDPALMELAEQFCRLETEAPAIFSVWGHSYEFEGDDNFDIMQQLCEYMAQQSTVHFATNTEIIHALHTPEK